MLVAVVAVMVLVLAAFELAAFPAGLMRFASEARTVAGSVAWIAGRPRGGWIFAVAEDPLGPNTPADPAVQAGVRINVPRRSCGQRTLGIAVFLE